MHKLQQVPFPPVFPIFFSDAHSFVFRLCFCRSHYACDRGRPCERCVSRNLHYSCTDPPPRKRPAKKQRVEQRKSPKPLNLPPPPKPAESNGGPQEDEIDITLNHVLSLVNSQSSVASPTTEVFLTTEGELVPCRPTLLSYIPSFVPVSLPFLSNPDAPWIIATFPEKQDAKSRFNLESALIAAASPALCQRYRCAKTELVRFSFCGFSLSQRFLSFLLPPGRAECGRVIGNGQERSSCGIVRTISSIVKYPCTGPHWRDSQGADSVCGKKWWATVCSMHSARILFERRKPP